MTFVLGGVKIDSIGIEVLHERIVSSVQSGCQTIICNANANAIVLAQKNEEFKRALNAADIVFCDGFGVLAASRFLGGDLRERVTYADWMEPLSALCEERGFSMFLLGGLDGIAAAAATRLLARHPRLTIAGTQHGYFEKTGAQNAQVIERINQVHPDVLLIGLGMPAQEVWLTQNRTQLNTRVMLPCGACLDYVSGRARRGPRWMTNHGLEWLARLVLEPRRLGRRYTLGLLTFARIVLNQKLHPAKP
ncbi:MAG TPA: WecB/TagA/CpsF family glycosyltransferase [Anaerolineae bacterium]|jgi:N-acetylglucosaminyldiphosphoundecaprenol N-acetyl-beta-D-mannosaminyltransferase